MALLQKGYLGATPLFREKSWFEEASAKLVDVSSSVTVTADSTSHVKGGWSEIIASTSANATVIFVRCNCAVSGQNSATLLDIATGASGAEVPIVSNIAIGGSSFGGATSNRGRFSIPIPIKVASGTRLSVRIQSLTASRSANVIASLFDLGDYLYAPTQIDVIGTSTATSAGTLMSGSSGSWVEIIASTSNAYKGLVLVPSLNSTNIVSFDNTYIVGKGASGSETEVGRLDVEYYSFESVANYPTDFGTMGGLIPSGTRLAIRHQIAANPERYAACLLGIR